MFNRNSYCNNSTENHNNLEMEEDFNNYAFKVDDSHKDAYEKNIFLTKKFDTKLSSENAQEQQLISKHIEKDTSIYFDDILLFLEAMLQIINKEIISDNNFCNLKNTFQFANPTETLSSLTIPYNQNIYEFFSNNKLNFKNNLVNSSFNTLNEDDEIFIMNDSSYDQKSYINIPEDFNLNISDTKLLNMKNKFKIGMEEIIKNYLHNFLLFLSKKKPIDFVYFEKNFKILLFIALDNLLSKNKNVEILLIVQSIVDIDLLTVISRP